MKFGPRKRKIQKYLNQSLFKTGLFQEGTILGLMGEDPVEYITQISSYFYNNTIILYEINWDRFLIGSRKIQEYLNNINNPNYPIIFYNHEDIFDIKISLNRFDISGIDFDFCEVLREDFAIYNGIKLANILNNNKSNFIWLRFTSSIGPDGSKKQILNRLNNIIDYIEKQTTYKHFGHKQVRTYRDSRAMLVWQIKLRRKEMTFDFDYSLSNRKEEEGKYMCDLTKKQRDRIRERLSKGEDITVIQRQYNLSKGTTTALLAHQTRGTY